MYLSTYNTSESIHSVPIRHSERLLSPPPEHLRNSHETRRNTSLKSTQPETRKEQTVEGMCRRHEGEGESPECDHAACEFPDGQFHKKPR